MKMYAKHNRYIKRAIINIVDTYVANILSGYVE